jgi:hypothetical protein
MYKVHVHQPCPRPPCRVFWVHTPTTTSHPAILNPAPPTRAKYDPDEYRREALQRLRRRMHEPLLDQLPCLKGLQRLLDEMAVGADAAARDTRLGSSTGSSDQGIAYRAGGSRGSGGGGSGGGARARLILEQVPVAREALTRGRDWPSLAAHLRDRWLGDGARQLARERAERMVRAFDFMCDSQQGPEEGGGAGSPSDSGPGCSVGDASSSCAGGATAAVRVECWRQVRAGVRERWCELDLAVDPARGPEVVNVASEDGKAVVRGFRRRLIPVDAAATRPLPCSGKVRWTSAARALQLLPTRSPLDLLPRAPCLGRRCALLLARAACRPPRPPTPSPQIVVRYGVRKAEAQLQLPSVAVRTHNDTPPGLWLTVGLLATDGLALQLRLKRADKVGRPGAARSLARASAASGAACTHS